ncbi:hypothetical protein AVEN_41480-2-1, partial [Araneus ventricosus]
ALQRGQQPHVLCRWFQNRNGNRVLLLCIRKRHESLRIEEKIRKIPHSVSGRINETERSDHQSSQGNEITEIWTDILSSVMAAIDPHTPHQLV